MGSVLQRFGDVEFDPARRTLAVDGRPIELDRPSTAILALLLNEAGRDVHKDRLLEAGWPGRVVHENSLAKAIGRLRQMLGPDGRALKTVHGHGYRLAAVVGSDAAGVADSPPKAPALRFRRRVALLLLALAFLGLGTWEAIALSNAGPRHVINGEAADAIGRILWVDDHPQNNIAERRYLEQHRIAVYQTGTTEDALTLLPMYQYAAVVSDMGRGNRSLAGIDLLKEMRARGDRRPFLLYTVHSSPAQRRLVAEAGGQGVVVDSTELYAAILPLFDAAK
jgi:DNA-binding response OmpR family regulator